ncbi:MAG: glycosyltransferase [Gemmatimonadota bacterium]|nr:glycosyltransferase [Gemmatimonadota bacterium]
MFTQRPAGGGSMTCLIDLVRSLDRDRFEPVVLTYQRDTGYEEILESLGATVVSLDRPPRPKGKKSGGSPGHETARPRAGLRQLRRLFRLELPVGRRIAAIIRREGIELVHHNDNPRGDRPSMLGAWMAGVPQTSHVRYTPVYYPPMDRRLAKAVSRYVPMSRAIRTQMEENLGTITTPVEVVYDPFHFDIHDRAMAKHVVTASDFGFGPDDYLVVNVGRIVPWKGQDVFLRALRKTVDQCPHVKAVIVGGTKDHERSYEYWDDLQALTDELGLRDSVCFSGFRTDVPSIMAAADLLVHTATWPEPFGKVLVEAMASRTPVVATAGGGPVEIVEEGKTGLLVPPSDPDALAAALIRMANDPEGSRAMGERARAVAEKRYGVESFRRTMDRIFTEALERAS